MELATDGASLLLDRVQPDESPGVVSRGQGILSCTGEGEAQPWGREDERRVGTELERVIGSLEGEVLAVVLILGGVIGAQIGTRLGARLRAEQMRILLALLVIAVAAKIALDLVLTPSELYSLTGEHGR